MVCSLAELPLPPPGKKGWPWTEPAGIYQAVMPGGQPWPRLSIITPSFNQADYLEETIRSVLLQGYPDLEFMIIDGGSTDGSLEIIQRYASWLAFWVSEPDNGQAEAINKGLACLTGTLAGWINSDDIYLPNAWQAGVIHMVNEPGCVLTYRDCVYIDESDQMVGIWQTQAQARSDLLLAEDFIPQPTVLLNLQAWRSVGGMDHRYHYILDFDLWVRLSLVGDLHYCPGAGASFRLHLKSKTITNQLKFIEELFTWLQASPYLAGVQTAQQRNEAQRRLHVRAAQEHIADGDLGGACQHLQTALHDGNWPYGGVDGLVERLVYSRSHTRRLLQESETKTSPMKQALQGVVPRWKGSLVWRRVNSLEHIRWLFQHDRARPKEARSHFLRGIYYNPGWLRNRGILSIGIELCFGQHIAGWLRWLFQWTSSLFF